MFLVQNDRVKSYKNDSLVIFEISSTQSEHNLLSRKKIIKIKQEASLIGKICECHHIHKPTVSIFLTIHLLEQMHIT